MASSKRLFPSIALQLANDDKLRRKVITEQNLRQLDVDSSLTLPNGTEIANSEFDGRDCQWPYAGITYVKTLTSTFSLTIANRLSTPRVEDYQRDCESVSGFITLKTRFQVGGTSYFSDGSSGFYLRLLRSPWLVHFDQDAKTRFSDPDGKIAVVSSDPVLVIYDRASSGPQPDGKSQQHFIEQTETLFDSAISGNRK